MSAYKVGDRVRDIKWGGEYVGPIKHIDDDGDLYVTWDGHWVECQMHPDEVRPEADGAGR